MEDVDTLYGGDERDDERMFLDDVAVDDHEFLFLDSYLREAFRLHDHQGRNAGSGL